MNQPPARLPGHSGRPPGRLPGPAAPPSRLPSHAAARPRRRARLAAAGLAFALALLACTRPNAAPPTPPTGGPGPNPPGFTLTSSAFVPEGAIPARYTCLGQDLSPPLAWRGQPPATQAYALMADDLDAPAGIFTHWIVVNLPAGRESLPEGQPTTPRLENGARQGANDFNRVGYGGPCPPSGESHHYRFMLYALDGPIEAADPLTKVGVLSALRGHVLGETHLTGVFPG